MEQSDAIEMKLVNTSFFTRWPCSVCGGWTEKVAILCEGVETLEDGSQTTIRVCERCLQGADDRSIDERLAMFAGSLEEQAKRVRARIGRLKVPTFAEWKERELREDVALFAAEFDSGRANNNTYEAVLANDG